MKRLRKKAVKVKYYNVLGIDPSLTCTGFCYVDKLGEIHTGRIMSRHLRGVQRLIYIRNCFDEIVKGQVLKSHPFTMVVYEGYSMGSRETRSYSTGELGGLLKVFFLEHHLKLLLVPPTTLKKFVTTAGNAPKEMVIDKIAEIWQYNIMQHDEADAFGLYQYGVAYNDPRVRRVYNRERRLALTKGELIVPEFANGFKAA